MTIHKKKIFAGSKLEIYEVFKSREWFDSFLSGLEKNDQIKLMASIRKIADNGKIINEVRFKHEQNQIYAIKSNQIRVYCFFEEDKLLLMTKGVKKKKQKANPKDLKHAEKLREEYLK